ncbi:uncharacterized protein LOC129227605 [Uloborus diversus]|uniref:uncharacterized protein LOC129227605 n=1 Tax=Uloborus diversus TaxID=327109 RepID=UPI0024095E79|nr:uncharacterized protein LOC129227605 [Uloborus diversus]XP_054718167.1 uncharacterized protein LOC129227605 [Uloborus diversus]XP_054718168.1 uncharacterized protein LOC129227605 [Uloborus diversus]
MLLLRYQRQRQEAEDGGRRDTSEHDMRRKISDRDLKGESHRAATRGTLICIFVCGSFLLTLGLVILFVGLLVPGPKKDPTPWLVIGPTCIVLGILVLLLSVEIIIKLRKISASSRGSAEPETPVKKGTVKHGWGNQEDGDVELGKEVMPKVIPVIVHPSTPLQLDATSLTADVVQHR